MIIKNQHCGVIVIKTVLLISGEKMFADLLVDFLLSDRFEPINLLCINSPTQIIESLIYEDVDLILNDLNHTNVEFAELIMQIHRTHRRVEQIDLHGFDFDRNDRNFISRRDSLSRLESVIKNCLEADAVLESRKKAESAGANKRAVMIIANLERLNELYALYEARDKRRFLLLIESVLNISRNHHRLSRLAGEFLVNNMTAFVHNFVGVFSLQNEFEKSQYPELNFNDQVNERMLFNFWQRFADLIFAAEGEERTPIIVSRTKEFVEENLRSELTVTMIADAVGVTSGYLSRVFSASEGKTLIHFVSEKKIAKSKQLLEDEKNSIRMIATEIGFSSPSYFIRFFKKFTGVTPKQYREGLHYK